MTSKKDHTYWMKQALEEASLAQDDVPVGCLILHDHKVIGRGHNERERSGDPTGHVEIVAMRQAAKELKSWRLSGTTLYTTLEPCPMCAEAMIQSRVTTVVFGAYDNLSGAAGSMFNLFCSGRIYPIPHIVGGIQELECRELMVNYFAQKANR